VKFTERDRRSAYSFCRSLFSLDVIGLEELVTVSDKCFGGLHADLTRLIYLTRMM